MNEPVWSFSLPEKLIAQEPTARRGQSRLLVLDRLAGEIRNTRFRHLTRFLRPGDLVVGNDSAVIPGRLFGRKPSGGRVEILLLERVVADGGSRRGMAEQWSCLVRPARRLRTRGRILFGGDLRGILGNRRGEIWEIFLESKEPLSRALRDMGRTPLPPYIRRERDDPRESMDRGRYQTVYAARAGSAAAPTAGLHFTPGILRTLHRSGVGWATVTLHLGAASFLPLRTPASGAGSLPAERFHLSPETARKVRRAKRTGHRVIAVGTSTTRLLESCWDEKEMVRPGQGACDLFIRPGFSFRVVDGLLTNFHLPGSTHLLLVAALAGRRRILEAYRQAMDLGYRFYSYGDAMLIL